MPTNTSNNHVDHQNSRGRTMLHDAVISNNVAAVQELLNNDPPANPNIRDNTGRNGFTPLYYAACQNRNVAITTALKNAGAVVDPQTRSEVARQSQAEPINPVVKAIKATLGLNP
jgi:ankyrin repeat protein